MAARHIALFTCIVSLLNSDDECMLMVWIHQGISQFGLLYSYSFVEIWEEEMRCCVYSRVHHLGSWQFKFRKVNLEHILFGYTLNLNLLLFVFLRQYVLHLSSS
jgi:hypothetical protein